MIYYKPVELTMDGPRLAEVVINVVVYDHKVLESIVSDQGLLFISMFWYSLYYLQKIKRKLSTIFHP